MLLNNKHNDLEKEIKMQKIYDQIWKKNTKESNYKTDNDIFGNKSNKDLQLVKFYRKTAKEIVESRIDNKLRVN